MRTNLPDVTCAGRQEPEAPPVTGTALLAEAVLLALVVGAVWVVSKTSNQSR